MAIRIQCPNPQCQQNVSVGESISGRRVRCRKCGTVYPAIPTIDGVVSETATHSDRIDKGPFTKFPVEFGRYRILQLLGKGGMGAVYLAIDSQLNRKVALKIPFFNAKEEPGRAERFIREARSAASLHHPNICTVFDVGEISGCLFITMAYIDGQPLEDLFDEDRLLPIEASLEIICKMALAIEKAHSQSIIHRDLKPANVMITPEGEPVIMDFGLAKVIGENDRAEARLTKEGAILGTPRYMSPEQVSGDQKAIGPATDVYSLGVMLFELLTGKSPFNGPIVSILSQISSAPVPRVRDYRADVDEELDLICFKAMAKSPADRFAGMTQLAEHLSNVLNRIDTTSAPSSATDPARIVSAKEPSAPLSVHINSGNRGGRQSLTLQSSRSPSPRESDSGGNGHAACAETNAEPTSEMSSLQVMAPAGRTSGRIRRIVLSLGGIAGMLSLGAMIMLTSQSTPVDESVVMEPSSAATNQAVTDSPEPESATEQPPEVATTVPALSRIELQGLWDVTSEQWGAGGPTEEWSKTVVRTLEFTGDQMKLVKTPPQGTPFGFTGTFTLDERRAPVEFDFVGTSTGLSSLVAFKGIIEVNGDELKLAYSMGILSEQTSRLSEFEVQPGIASQQFLTAKRREVSQAVAVTVQEADKNSPTLSSPQAKSMDSAPVSEATPSQVIPNNSSNATTTVNSDVPAPANAESKTSRKSGARFDGRRPESWNSLSGWSFDDGVISASGQVGVLWTNNKYEDFELELEYQTSGDGGIFFHGLEVQLANGPGYDAGGTGSIYLVSPAAPGPFRQNGWNRVSVTVKGSRVVVSVNGKQTTALDRNRWTTAGRNPDGTKNDKPVAVRDLARTSPIGLQCYQGRTSYRNVVIRGNAVR